MIAPPIASIDTGLSALRPFATEAQVRVLDAVIAAGGNKAAAAKALGLARGTVTNTIDAVRKKAARVDPTTHDYTGALPPGYHLRGVSQQLDANGNIISQWVKSQVDPAADRIAALLEAVEGIADRLPIADVIEGPAANDNGEVLCVYPMGDPHVGMYAWADECGASFDLDIAEQQIVTAVDHLVALAPEGSDALVINVGDFFHSDHQGNTTRKSGHQLDVDTRWARVLAVGVRIMCRLVDRALQRHRTVKVVNAIGNHDDHTSVVLSICLAHHYAANPRVAIDTSPAKVHYHRFGRCLIGVTHGDTIKAAQLGPIMATDKAEDWGATVHRYWYTGHVHHDSAKEFPGVIVETFRTLAPRDAWHAGQGYRSGQDMRLDVVHAQHGRTNRHIVGIEQVRAAIAAGRAA